MQRTGPVLGAQGRRRLQLRNDHAPHAPTHALPAEAGVVNADVKARDAEAFARLIELALDFCRRRLLTPHWGEQIIFRPKNVMQIRTEFQGIGRTQATAIWNEFFAAVRSRADRTVARGCDDHLRTDARRLESDFLRTSQARSQPTLGPAPRPATFIGQAMAIRWLSSSTAMPRSGFRPSCWRTAAIWLVDALANSASIWKVQPAPQQRPCRGDIRSRRRRPRHGDKSGGAECLCAGAFSEPRKSRPIPAFPATSRMSPKPDRMPSAFAPPLRHCVHS